MEDAKRIADPAHTGSLPTLRRLQIAIEADPLAVAHVLIGLVKLETLPKRLSVAQSSSGTLRIELDITSLAPDRLELAASGFRRLPGVLRVRWFQMATPAGNPRQGRLMCALSEREREVLRELSLGRSDKEIARGLALAAATVNFHLRNIFRKLGVRKRASAVHKAYAEGWLT